jgi:hypothetical protein
MWGIRMAKRRIAFVLFVAIVAAVISPALDLLPTTLRVNHHHHQTALTGCTTAPGLLQAPVHNAAVSRATPGDVRAACILSMDCVRLC